MSDCIVLSESLKCSVGGMILCVVVMGYGGMVLQYCVCSVQCAVCSTMRKERIV